MADQDTTFRLKFENEDMERVFNQLIDRIDGTTDELRRLEKTQKDAFDSMAKSGRAVNEQMQQQASRLDANAVRFKNLKDVGNEAFSEIENSGNQAVGTLARVGRAAGPVGAAIAAIGGAVIAAFLDVEANAKKAKAELEGLKAIGNELKDRVFAGLRAAAKAAIGDIGGAAVEAQAIFNGVNGSLAEVQRNGRNIALLRDQLSSTSRQLLRIEAERVVELQRIQALAADETRTTEQRVNLIRSAASLEERLNSTKISQLSFQLDILNKQNDTYGRSPEILDEIATIESELIELRGANQLIAIQTQQEINALLREEAEARERIIEAIKDANAEVTNEEPTRALEKQIQLFKELRDSATAAGLGDEYGQEIAEIERVIEQLEGRLRDGLVKPFEELPTLVGDAIDERVISDTATPLGDALSAGAEEAIDRLGVAFRDKFQDLTEDQRRFIEDQFGSIFESVGDIVVSSTLTAIGQQDEVIDARERSISELERQLAEEEDLQAQGVANNASRLRQGLQEERQILRREQQRRLELEKRAARQRLVFNSIQQASELTLATAKLLQQGASGFIPGLIAAAGGIALLFRIIAQAKANAAAFSSPPQFREGTEWLSGPSHEGGGVLIEAEGGERILSKALNEAVGGRQLTNEELVDFALRGMNADSAIAPMAAAVIGGAAARQVVEEVDRREQGDRVERAIREEVQQLRKEMRQVIRERPTYYPTDQAGRREYYRDGTKVVEKITPKK